MKKIIRYCLLGLSAALIITSCSKKKKDLEQSMSIGGSEVKLDGGCVYKYLSPSNADYPANDSVYIDGIYSLSLNEIILYNISIQALEASLNDSLYEGHEKLVGIEYDTIPELDENLQTVDVIVEREIYDTTKYFIGQGHMIRLQLLSSSVSGLHPGIYTFDDEAYLDGYYPNTVIMGSSYGFSQLFQSYNFDAMVGDTAFFKEGTVNIKSIDNESNMIDLEFDLKTTSGVVVKGKFEGGMKLVNEYDKYEQERVRRGDYTAVPVEDYGW